MSRTRLLAAWCAAVLAAGASTLALALLLGRGAPPPAPPGLDDGGRTAAWLGAIASYLGLVLGVVTVGLALVASGVLDRPRERPRAIATALAALWAALTVLQLGLLAWELRGRGVDVFDTSRAQALLVQLILVVVAAAAFNVSSGRFGTLLGAAAALAALLPVVLAGHPRSADNQLLASVSVSIHVVSAAIWVGGLSALFLVALSDGNGWGDALRRYSRLAAGCVAALVLSGVVTTVGRLDAVSELLSSRYGAIVLLKIVFLVALVGAGWMQREYVVRRSPVTRRRFVPVASVEITIMVLTMALASALSRTPPPV
jgi:putative copper resistance protein D